MLCFLSKKSAEVYVSRDDVGRLENIVHTSISRVEGHGLKPFMLREGRACPFPEPTHLGLSCQTIAAGCNRYRMPLVEAHIGITEINEEVVISRQSSIDLGRGV